MAAIVAVAGASALPSSAMAAPSCTTDPFDGDALGARWEVRNPAAGLGVADGRLSIEMSNTDLISGTTTAQNVPLTELPSDAGWIASTRLNISAINAAGEQGGLALWRDGRTFAKVTFIQNNSNQRGFEFITTEDAQQAIPIPNSFVPIPAGLPADADVSIRLRSTGQEVVAEYSVDGTTGWTKIGQTWKVTGAMKAGPLALRGSGGGGAVLFDSFSLLCGEPVTLQADKLKGVAPLEVAYDGDAADGATLAWDFGDSTETGQEDRSHTFTQPGTFRTTLSATNADGVTTTTAAAAVTVQAALAPCPIQSDEFQGNALRSRWQVLRPMPTGLEVSGGALRLKPYGGDMHGTNASVRNLLLQTMPNAAWTATLKVDVSGLTNSGQTGLVVWRGESPNDFAKVVFNKRSTTNYWVERQNNIGGVTQGGGGNAGENANPPATILIRVASDGIGPNPLISASYSINDGTSWIGVRDPFRLGGSGAIKLGPAYWGGPNGSTAAFDSFVVDSTCDGADRTPPLTMAPAANEHGWLTDGAVTLTAIDPSPLDASPFEDPLASETSGVAKTEYRLDGAQEWTTYTAPVPVGAGSHTLDYHSVDTAGNIEAVKTVTVMADGDAPETTATLDPAEPGAGGTYTGPVDVTLAAQDAPAGVASTEYRVDGGEWKAYGAAPETIYDGSQAARDKWLMAGPGDFVRQPDGSLQTSGGLGMLWYPERQYGDFSLTFEWREARTDGGHSNGGAFARFPDPRTPADQRGDWGACNTGSATSQPAWVAIYCGHEFQIYDGPTGEVQKTGSVYNFQPLGLTQAQPSPRGEWNTYELRAVGQMYWILRNGKVINQFDNSVDKASSRAGDPPTQARRFAAGFIGLQNHGSSDLLQYRNIRVTELEPAEGTFTVAGEGDHVVEFRSTDFAGNVEETDSVEFAIQAPTASTCTTDPFDGTALNDARWDVLNPGDGLTVANGKLGLGLFQGDLFQNMNDARNVVLQDLPADTGWTITTRLNTAAVETNGEQAGLALFKSEGPPNASNVYAKATFIQTGSGARGFEFIPTDGGQLPIPTADSFVAAPAGLPADADVSVRLRSDGHVVVAEYSVDGTTGWTQIGKAFEVSGALKAGPYAVRGANGGGVVEFDSVTLDCGPAVTLDGDKTTGTAPLAVAFDGEAPDGATLAWTFGDGTTETGQEDRTHTFTEPGTYRVTLTATGANGVKTTAAHRVTVAPSTPPCPVQSDEFNGNALDPKWEVLRPSATSLDVAGGNLRLTPFGGDMHGNNANVRNLLLQAMPSGAWTATTKIDVSQLTSTGDQTGLVVWRGEGPNNFAKVVFNRRQNAPNSNYWFERQNNIDGVTQPGGGDAGTLSNPPASGVYIRVVSDGAANPTISAAYSLDGTTWVGVRDPFQLGGSGPIKVGPAYWRTTATTVAAFDWFRVTSPACEEEPGDTTAPTTAHTLAPATPDGSAGWYRTAPQVTLSAADEAGGSGVARTEYRIDGAATWTAYTAPFAAPAGSHTIEYRSVDEADNVETAKSVAVKVDATAPTTTLATAPGTPQGQNGWFTAAPQVTLTGADNAGGSGLATREYRIDGGAWTAYTAAFAAPAGSHTIEYRSTDAAGNTGTAGSATVKVDTAAPTVTAAVAPGEPDGNDGWFVTRPELTLTAEDADGSGVAGLEYRVGGGDWTAYSAPVELADGTRTVTYRATDNAGTVSAVGSRSFKVDSVAPATTPKATPTGGATAPVVLTATAADAAPGSGLAGTEVRVDGGAWSPYTAAVAVLAPGAHTAEFRSTDVAGNVEAAQAVAFTIAAPSAPSGQNPPPPPPGEPQPKVSIDRADGLSIASFRRSGLTVQVSCSLVDSGRISLSVTKRVARKLKLRGTRTLAAADLRCDAGGHATVYLQPGKRVRKALAKSKRAVRATITVRMGAVRDAATLVLSKR